MKKIIIYSLVIASSLSLISCEKWLNGQVVDFDLPSHTPVLTLYAFWESGEDFLDVRVSESTSIAQNERPEPVENINIKLYKNDQLTDEWSPEGSYLIDTLWYYFDPFTNDTIYFIDSTFSYATQLSEPIAETTEEYRIEVSATGYETISSKITVPEKANVSQATIERDVPVTGPSYDPGIPIDPNGDIIKFTIDDPAGETNYYFLSGEVEYEDDDGNTYTTSFYFDTRNPMFDYNTGGLTFTDETFDGQQRTFEFERWFYEDDIKPTRYKISVVSLPKEYNNFFESLDKYWNADGNPFAEPVILYTNVEAGLGLFVIYNPTVFILE